MKIRIIKDKIIVLKISTFLLSVIKTGYEAVKKNVTIDFAYNFLRVSKNYKNFIEL